MWAGVLGRTRLAGCCPSIGAHFFRFSHSVAASIHGTGGQPEPRVDRRARARVASSGSNLHRVLEYGYFDKTCGCEFPGRWLHDLAGLRAIVHVRDYGKVPFRVHHAPHPVIQPHLAHDSCGPRSTRWLRKLTPRGSSLSDPAGRTGSIVRTSSATQVCSDDGKRACPGMAGGTSSRLSTSCRGRRRNLRQDSRRR